MSILALRSLPRADGRAGRDRRDDAGGWIAGGRRILTRWVARSRQRRALREIAERSEDHLLKDIGVSRQEAFQEAEKPFWRP